MVNTVLLCLLGFMFLCFALGIECGSKWKWFVVAVAYGFAGSLALNQIVMLDSSVSQFFLNLLVVAGVYASASSVLSRRTRC